MPDIKVDHVVSCSSEDRNNPAVNLLKAEGTHKWRTAKPGEKNATVILQFEKASQICGIDIGNEGSAFVEVLVGKVTSAAESEYQVLLVSSSFMTPADSRSGNNRNAVRMFSADKLSKTVATEKWDRVKIVCTQPFNKSATYGLSFIKFHSTPDAKAVQKDGGKKLGAFFLKKDADDDDDDDIKVGTLFANRGKKDIAVTPTPTGAAAVRAASRLAEEPRPSTSRTPSHDRNSSATSTSKAGRATSSTATPVKAAATKPRPKANAVSDDDTEEDVDDPAPPRRSPLKRQSSSLSSVASSRSADAPPPLKKIKSWREKAVEMGAVYKPDWGRTCTHLICAFTNTPKYNQVKGRGRIVSKQWINDCYKQKKLLPWRKYRLGDAETPDESSDEEDNLMPRKPTPAKRTPTPASATKKNATPVSLSKKNSKIKDDEAYGGDTDSLSADDTDEEMRRVAQKQKAKKQKPEIKDEPKVKVKPKVNPTLDLFADSTDEDEPEKGNKVAKETENGSDSGLPDLPDFFSEKHFFLYGSLEAAERRLLTRYIAAYNGVLEEYMNDRVKYVITSSNWDDNFEEAVSENPNLLFVKPQWVRACHQKTKLLPHQPYIVVP